MSDRIKTRDGWQDLRAVDRRRYAIAAVAWIALGAILGVVVTLLVACGAASAPAPPGPVPGAASSSTL